MTIKDAADLFAAEGEEAKEILDALREEAQDVLDLVLAEAPSNSTRESYRYVKEQVFPLIQRLEDKGVQNAGLKDVATKLKLRYTDMRDSFAEFVEQSRQEHEQKDDEEAREATWLPNPTPSATSGRWSCSKARASWRGQPRIWSDSDMWASQRRRNCCLSALSPPGRGSPSSPPYTPRARRERTTWQKRRYRSSRRRWSSRERLSPPRRSFAPRNP